MSDIDSSDVTVGRRTPPEKFEPADVPGNGGASRSEREGLPASYRMRADPHYVEQLSSRRERLERAEGTRHHTGSGEMGEREGAAEQREQRERRSDRVLAQLNDEITTISSAAALLAADASPLARRLGVDLIRAQAWRASWLLRATALLDGSHRGQTRQKPLVSILEQVRQGLAPECRLAGVSLQLQASDWNAAVSVDESVLIAGITGAIIATLGIIDQAEGATIRVSADIVAGELRSVDIAQDEVTVPAAAGLRFFDLSWAESPRRLDRWPRGDDSPRRGATARRQRRVPARRSPRRHRSPHADAPLKRS